MEEGVFGLPVSTCLRGRARLPKSNEGETEQFIALKLISLTELTWMDDWMEDLLMNPNEWM